jgi:hypothetical protein
MKLFGLFVLVSFGISQCETEEKVLTKEDEWKQLQEMYGEIQGISESVTCSDASTWTFTAIGSKPCGGPTGYVAYSKSINESSFLEKIKTYNELQQAYNEKWGLSSDCMMVMPPSEITCVDNKPNLVYDNNTL